MIAQMLTNVANGVTAKKCLHKIIMPEKYSITVICPHDIATIKVLESVATCETTVLVCTACGEEIEKPKTECS